MRKFNKILFLIGIFIITLLLKTNTVKAAEYKWPIGGNNASETYIDYEFYGDRNGAPIKDGKSGRAYTVDNTKWPNELYYRSTCESHYGMDITGIYGHTYSVISVVNGTVLATSANRVTNPSVNYIDRNQRRTSGGLKDGGGYGNYVIIQETSTGRCFLYAHLKGGTIKVSKGATVTPGQEIATMGSSGDSGHMHLHFEIRKSKSCMLNENRYGRHSLVTTTSNTNLDPKDYIGSGPDVHTPVTDTKRVNISKNDAKYYIKYLYRTVLSREATSSEVEGWATRYMNTGSIYEVTRGIFLSGEANTLSNLDFSKKAYEIILHRGNRYTEQEMAGHVARLDDGVWTRDDYLIMLCNCDEFVNNALASIISTEKSNSSLIRGLAPADKLNTIGDLNADGNINTSDASICLSMILIENSDYSYAIKYADLDKDGKITTNDAALILKYLSMSLF